jgi:hypothetical protein
MKGQVMITWDRVGQRYRYYATWTWTNKMDLGGGKTINSRFTIVETSPTVHNLKWEMSEDGKAWKVVLEGTSTKTGG